MKNITNVMEDVSIGLGITLGISEIKTILGIVLLVFQIVLIIYKMVRAIIKKIKNKDYDGVEQELNDGIHQIEEHLKDKSEDGKDGK